jgi:hypothetical protein
LKHLSIFLSLFFQLQHGELYDAEDFLLAVFEDTASMLKDATNSANHFSTLFSRFTSFTKDIRGNSKLFSAASGEFFFSLLIWKTVGELMSRRTANSPTSSTVFSSKALVRMFLIAAFYAHGKSLMLFLCILHERYMPEGK